MFYGERVLELGALGGYLFILLWIGIRSARQVKSSADYTLAGRNIPWIIVMATTAATMIGGGASVGMVARVSEIGIAAALVTCAWHLQLIFTGLFIAPKLRGLNLITVGDFFHLKFGPLARELAVVNCVIFLLGALVAQMVAIGMVTNAVLGIDYGTALFIGAAVTIFYSTVGGIRAVVKTDVLQFTILVVGIGTAAAILYFRNGGFSEMFEAAAPGQFHITSQWPTTRVISLFFAFLLGEILVPPYTVRCFIAKDSRQAKWGVAGGGIFLLLFLPVSTFVLGTSAQISPAVQQTLLLEKQKILQTPSSSGKLISEEKAEQQAYQIAFPALVRTTLHPALAGVVIAAIVAAIMSSADSCLSCLAAVVMEDYYRRHVNRKANDQQLLRIAKWSTLLMGVGTAVCAWSFRNITEILEFVYDFWSPTMVLPFLVAIFWYHKSRIYAVTISMIIAFVATLVWRIWPATSDVGAAMFGCVVALITFFVVWPLTARLPLIGLIQPGGEVPEVEGDST